MISSIYSSTYLKYFQKVRIKIIKKIMRIFSWFFLFYPFFRPRYDWFKFFWETSSFFCENILNFYRIITDYFLFYKTKILKFFEARWKNTWINIWKFFLYFAITTGSLRHGSNNKKRPFLWYESNKGCYRTHSITWFFTHSIF